MSSGEVEILRNAILSVGNEIAKFRTSVDARLGALEDRMDSLERCVNDLPPKVVEQVSIVVTKALETVPN